MSRRPARITEVEIRRIIAAAKKEGARAVELYNGLVVVRLDESDKVEEELPPLIL